MAACLLRPYDNATFPVPTLTVGGEKDGNMRVSRLAQASHIYRRQGDDVAARFPVVVIPGANHMSFASGVPPLNVAAVDLTPEISRAEGHTAIAAVVADFLRARVAAAAAENKGTSGGGQDLAAALKATAELVDPLIEAMLLEGSWRFDAPCNSDRPSPHCPFYPAWPEQPEERAPRYVRSLAELLVVLVVLVYIHVWCAWLAGWLAGLYISSRPYTHTALKSHATTPHHSNVTACVCGSAWVEQVAQPHVGDLEGYATYVVRDAFHDVRDTGEWLDFVLSVESGVCGRRGAHRLVRRVEE
jgi:hypothetical protein